MEVLRDILINERCNNKMTGLYMEADSLECKTCRKEVYINIFCLCRFNVFLACDFTDL